MNKFLPESSMLFTCYVLKVPTENINSVPSGFCEIVNPISVIMGGWDTQIAARKALRQHIDAYGQPEEGFVLKVIVLPFVMDSYNAQVFEDSVTLSDKAVVWDVDELS